jgi:hypothetical protein
MTHAYLIMAHNEFPLLTRLVSALDYPGNSFFVHIDKKVGAQVQLRKASGRRRRRAGKDRRSA